MPVLNKRRLPAYLLLVIISGLLLVGVTGYSILHGSLPQLNGEITSADIPAEATVTRDAQGIAFIESEDRSSSAFALGYLHAQERFFQMDLLRRNSAGELSALVGAAALPHDRKIRVHQFRARAERNLDAMPAEQRKILKSYVRGVNQGLTDLDSAPWEYTLLGQDPAPWTEADSSLAIFSMYLALQSPTASHEFRDTALEELLPADLYQFFFREGGRWDAPLIGDARTGAPLPDTPIAALLQDGDDIAYIPFGNDDKVYGSNNWVVGGALTDHGGAILADDMHLELNVPNIWYRAGWTVPGTTNEMRGATLPGGPIMVVGSNSKVAWGFTNTMGDWGDLVVLEVSDDGKTYRTPDGFRPFELEQEQLAVKGQDAETLTVKKTIWGPVVAENHRGELLALRWVAHDSRGANLNLLNLEKVSSTSEALDLGPTLGIPHQNLVVGDADGNIGWTVGGAIPKRVGFDGARSTSWADGDKYWDGYLDVSEQPRVYNPLSHRIWTANARTMDGDFLRKMGDHGYALGARQQQIRDGLFARERFDEQALLDIQLDDRAVFLQRWQAHLLSLLDAQPDDSYAEARELVANWGSRASSDSAGYRIVRNFRLEVIEMASAPVVTYMRKQLPDFEFGSVKRQMEYPVWDLITQRPAHLLNPDFESWETLQLAALDKALDKIRTKDGSLAQGTWGAQNTAQIQHPLGRVIAPVNWLTAMPADPLPGDSHMPRFQSPKHGASQRMVVSPGREDNAIFHMATGQSANPLSPFFGNGHEDWAAGKPSPLKEQKATYTLVFKPER